MLLGKMDLEKYKQFLVHEISQMLKIYKSESKKTKIPDFYYCKGADVASHLLKFQSIFWERDL